jgi:hypothetical protein
MYAVNRAAKSDFGAKLLSIVLRKISFDAGRLQ